MANEPLKTAVVTDIGIAKLDAAYQAGEKVIISQMALGDSNLAYVVPDPAFTELVNEFGRQDINEGNTTNNWINAIVYVDSTRFAGNSILEFGLYDTDGDLIVYSSYTPSVVPAVDQDYIQLEIECSVDLYNASAVTIEVTPIYPQATELERGIAKVATEADVAAGIDDEKIVTSKKMAGQYVSKSRLATLTPNTFIKAETSAPAFMVSGGQLKTATALTISVGGVTVTHAANEVISTPVLLVGVDYAIYATADGLVVSNNFTVPDGYTAENSRRVGGFHYGNNEYKDYSFYDLHFRPACKDPRGMVIDISGSRFWNDIYLLNSTPDALGTSAYNAQIADGSSPCKIPAIWGGDGIAQYPNLTQYIAAEVLAAYGKRLPSHDEFEILALGSTPGYAVGADPVTTKFDVNARSKNGSEQVSGHLWQWGKDVWDRGNGSSGYTWYATDTNGEGQVYSTGTQAVGAVLLGAYWDDSGFAGARASLWVYEPWSSVDYVGARGLCDHLLHV
ncbi:Phage tail fiber [Vibrio cholerae]|uniref:phage major tropism determinant n=1 Tax=Vibrio cholerae TaxID=666 RepID=UPI0011D5705D|nr:phage tail protein [Vibrio cholerae]EGR2496678.1 hypothetical protein [Vibrio cholerae]TXZ57303.1 hypothetical protein FXE54_03220 [Vibrio cholerae]GHW19720.1 Phage tail fiber [Vibrio cholerae]